MAWLIRLRWASTVGQLVAIIFVDRVLGVPLPVEALLAVVGVGALPNIVYAALTRRRRDPSRHLIAKLERWPSRAWSGLLMILDTVLLTALLYLTGGPFNPFSFLYLVPIALAAIMLPSRWAWGLVAFALGCFGALFAGYRPLPMASHADHMRVHTQGMWVAFGVAAAFIVHFLMRVTAALAEREVELAAARNLAERQKQIASLAALAAGTAHELATPLATVAVAAGELERTLAMMDTKRADDGAANSALASAVADAKLIRQQLQHCRDVLDRMSLAGGEFVGERLAPLSGRELIERAVAEIIERRPIRILADECAGSARIHAPPNALAEGLRCLIRNAQEVSPSDEPVIVRASLESGWLHIAVEDGGPGMSPEVLKRAGEPFFTTKPSGAGMGLGLFVTRALVEKLGGSLGLASLPGRGTTATIRLLIDRASLAQTT